MYRRRFLHALAAVASPVFTYASSGESVPAGVKPRDRILRIGPGREIRTIADAALASPGDVAAVRAFAADAAPFDLRRERASWQVAYADGLNVYIDALTGETLAVRSNQWRWFDLMWGLHIMDLQTREDTSHPLLIGFAALAFFGSLMGTILLFRRRKAGIRSNGGRAAQPPQP